MKTAVNLGTVNKKILRDFNILDKDKIYKNKTRPII